MKRTSGRWNPDERFVYFTAGPVHFIENVKAHHKDVLVAVNELMGDDWRKDLAELLKGECKILLDSGAFSVASSHSKTHDVPLDEAFRLPLESLDGFAVLKSRLLEIVGAMKNDLWGIVEIDLGGEKQKMATRAELEGHGFVPIPVYHPFGDSPEYFDHLIQNYDRVCVGNLVQASRWARKRIYSFMSQALRRRVPNYERVRRPWIHLLGVTPSELSCAWPFNSCDSSAWLNVVRWSGYVEKACLRSVGHLHKNYQYELGDRDSWSLGIKMGAIGAKFQGVNLNNYLNSTTEAMPWTNAA